MKAEMHRQILTKAPRASLGLFITVFLVRMRFSSVRKTWLARGARNGRSATLADETGYFELQRQILIEATRESLGSSITVFSVRMRFSSVRKTGLARGARNDRSATLADKTGYFELQRQILRGRRPVRADRRLRTDEKRVHTQSTILYKSNPKPNWPGDAGKHGATHD